MKPLRSREYPVGHILNPATPYRNSASTDVAATFERIRREQAEKILQREHGPAVRRIR